MTTPTPVRPLRIESLCDSGPAPHPDDLPLSGGIGQAGAFPPLDDGGPAHSSVRTQTAHPHPTREDQP